jgi:hypothetical protein
MRIAKIVIATSFLKDNSCLSAAEFKPTKMVFSLKKSYEQKNLKKQNHKSAHRSYCQSRHQKALRIRVSIRHHTSLLKSPRLNFLF